MARGRPLKPLEVSQGAREELESLARSRSLPAGLVRRAEIVLLCADGLDNKTVAGKVRSAARRSASGASASERMASWACTTNAGREGRAPSRTRRSWGC